LNIEQNEINQMVASIVSAMVHNPRFVDAIKEKISSAVDTSELEHQADTIKAQLRQRLNTKSRLEHQMDTLDFNDPYYDRKSLDLQRRYDEQYELIGDMESQLAEIQGQIDDIHQAMHENQPVTFVYCEWNQNKELVPRHGGERYLVSPWMLMWEDENYYLLAYDHKAEMIKYFRVDKLRQLKREEGKREGETAYQKLDVTDFSKKTFGMFAGEKKRLQLVFDNSLIGVAIDRFGKEIPVLKESETQFRTFVEISVSKQFYGWLAGIGKGVSIVEPKEEQEKYRKYLENIWKL